MRIVVLGGGAMGLTHAAMLNSVADVTLLVRRAEQAEALAEHGTTVVDVQGSRRTEKVPASVDPESLHDAELVLVAVKSYNTDAVADQLGQAGGKSAVLSLQNGIAHNDTYAARLGPHNVLLGKTGYAGTRSDNTTVLLSDGGTTAFGEADGTMSERVLRMESVFKAAGIQAEASDRARSVVWSKFAQACCQNALAAVTRKSFAELYEQASARDLLAELSREMTALAQAEDVELLFDPETQLLKNWNGLRHRSSMLQDLEAGRPTEVDALNGEAVRRGARFGLAMPVNRSLWQLVTAAEVP